MARTVFLHYHIFKNAGSTIEWVLERNFGHAADSYHAVAEGAGVRGADLVRYLEARPHIASVTSHLIFPPPLPDDRFRFVEICLVRHPLDRLQSIYRYYRGLGASDDLGVRQAQQAGMRDFLAWLLAHQPFNAINGQTCYLGNAGRYLFPAPRHVDRAAACLRDMAVVGVVERMDESLVTAEHFLRAIDAKLDFAYVAQNPSAGRAATLAERLEAMREECGDDFYRRLEGLNELDLQLLAAAEAELDRRLDFVPKRELAVAEFRARCEALRTWGQSASGAA